MSNTIFLKENKEVIICLIVTSSVLGTFLYNFFSNNPGQKEVITLIIIIVMILAMILGILFIPFDKKEDNKHV